MNLITKRAFHKTVNLTSQAQASIKIVEVGPRDGLQNEKVHVPSEIKIELINKLSETGLQAIEVTSVVSPKWVPQMSDNTTVFKGIRKKAGIEYHVLIPNLKGLQDAVAVDAKFISVFASASEGFSQRNINCSIDESLKRIKEVVDGATRHNLRTRAFISCIAGCPYDGKVKASSVTKIADVLLNYGCDEIALGDTIGVGTKSIISNVIKDLTKIVPIEKISLHCHDTYGQALANICTALDLGVTIVDSSVSGLGGCPYARGATGNVATEDLVYMLHGLGASTGVDLEKLIDAGQYISTFLNKKTESRVNNALYSKKSLKM